MDNWERNDPVRERTYSDTKAIEISTHILQPQP